MILADAHFNVLSATNAAEAIQTTNAAGRIHLLLSGIMMPDMSGPALALKLKESRPEMRVMLMSGYANGALLILNYGWYFIQKPFLAGQLVKRINNVLHSEPRDQGPDHFDTRR